MRTTILPLAISLAEYCGLRTASEVFLISTTQLYQYFFSICTTYHKLEVFFPKYSQTAILHAAHFRRVVTMCICEITDPSTCTWFTPVQCCSQ